MMIDNHEYSLLMGSDLERNGMFLELYDAATPNGRPIAECFYSDSDGSFVTTQYVADTSSAALAWLRSEAERTLRPVDGPV